MSQSAAELGSQRWNVSNSIASQTINVVLSVVGSDPKSVSREDIDKEELNKAVNELKSETDYWPYEDVDEVFDSVRKIAEFDDGPDGVQDLARYVNKRFVDEVDRVTPSESYEQLDLAGTEPENTKTSTKSDSKKPDTEKATHDTTTSNTQVDSKEDHPSSSQSGSDISDQDLENADHNERIDVGDGSETWEIAKDLYYCFLSGGNNFVDIQQKYSTPFPDRTVLLTDVINTSGTPEERIGEIERLVREWYDDDEAVDQLNQFKRKPMGMA